MPKLIHKFPVPHQHYFGSSSMHEIASICQCDCGQYAILCDGHTTPFFEPISKRKAMKFVKKNVRPKMTYYSCYY